MQSFISGVVQVANLIHPDKSLFQAQLRERQQWNLQRKYKLVKELVVHGTFHSLMEPARRFGKL
jgi:hypothetical protein